MTDDELLRAHDPFSGHAAPAPAEDTSESKKPAEEPAPPAESLKKAPARRGRRPRRTPSASEVESAARKARRA